MKLTISPRNLVSIRSLSVKLKHGTDTLHFALPAKDSMAYHKRWKEAFSGWEVRCSKMKKWKQ